MKIQSTSIMTPAISQNKNHFTMRSALAVCFLLSCILSLQGFANPFYWTAPPATNWNAAESNWKAADGTASSSGFVGTYIIDPNQSISGFSASNRADANTSVFSANNLTVNSGGRVVLDASARVDTLTLNGGSLGSYSTTARTWGNTSSDIILGDGTTSTFFASGGTESSDVRLTINASIEGEGDLTLIPGNGVIANSFIQLNAANTHTGTTSLDPRYDAGKLILNHANALQSSTLNLDYDYEGGEYGKVTFNQNSTLGGLEDSGDAAALDLDGYTISVGNNGHDTTFDGVISNGGLAKIGTGTLTLTGNGTYAGTTTVTGGGAIRIESDNALGTTAGNTVISGGSGDDVDARVELAGGISTPEPFFLRAKTGSSTSPHLLNVSGDNTLTGAITTGMGGSAFNLQSDAGLFTVQGGFTETTSGNDDLNLLGAGDGEFTGGISNDSGGDDGILRIKKYGSGTWTLSGTTDTRDLGTGPLGTVTVYDGTLIVDGPMYGDLTVESGGKIGGTGTITGDAVISGLHAPGNSPGIETITGNLSYTGGSSEVEWELTGNTNINQANPNAVFDQIVVTNNLDFTDSTTLTLVFDSTHPSQVLWDNAFWETDRLGTSGWLVYDVGGTTTKMDPNLSIASTYLDSNGDSLNSFRYGWSFFLYQDDNDIYLNYQAGSVIPEPSTAILAGLGLAGMCLRRRKRK